jgi:hypothetical protein
MNTLRKRPINQTTFEFTSSHQRTIERVLPWGTTTMQSDSDPTPAIPRHLSLVRFRHEEVPCEYHAAYPFMQKHTYVFFGEIPNMPGHCVVADHVTGQVFSGYHTENFVEIDEDEA